MRPTLCVGILFVFAARADVTLRYSFEIKPGPMLPPQAVAAMKRQMQAPMGVVTRVKGSKAYAEMMGITTLSDFDATRITILDPKGKRFATVSADEYVKAAARQGDLPPEAHQAMEAMKFDVQARTTGRNEVIHDIPAEEREVVLTMEVPAGPQGSPGPMRFVLSFWRPTEDAAAGNPALRELAQYAARAYAGMNPAEMMQKLFGQLQGMGEKLRPLMEETRKMQPVLRVRGTMFMPGLAAMMEKLREAGQQVPANVDPNAPLMEFLMDLQELSTAELPDSLFQVPADYEPAPLEELLKSATSAMPKP